MVGSQTRNFGDSEIHQICKGCWMMALVELDPRLIPPKSELVELK